MALMYTVRDAAKIVGLSASTVRSYARAGYLSPSEGPLGEMRFSFQDLLVLQTARGLMKARVPAARIRRVLSRLQEQLPSGRSLSAIRIMSSGRGIVVSDGRRTWDPETGQAVLDFQASSIAEKVAPLARARTEAEPPASAQDWFERGLELEPVDLDAARDAYRRSIELAPTHVDAHVNLGRLLHEADEVQAAAAHYRVALESRPHDVTAAFNLGVALTDLGRYQEAIEAYRGVLRQDDAFADAHFNLSRLYERKGRKAAALRHLRKYRALTEPRRSS